VGYYNLGLTPEETADQMDLDLASVYAALAYYHLNKDNLEADVLAHVERPIDTDVAGINYGANLGHTVTYLGTVTAAREGVIAVSLAS
jgi:5'-nucleotidase